MYIVKIDNDMYLASWGGDPPRTYIKANAKKFRTEEQAMRQVEKEKKKHAGYRECTYVVMPPYEDSDPRASILELLKKPSSFNAIQEVVNLPLDELRRTLHHLEMCDYIIKKDNLFSLKYT